MESKEFKALKEQLLSCRRNGFDRMDAAERSAMESYCTDYKAFLDTSKTERLCAGEVVRLAEQAGYRPYVRGAAVKPGDKVYLCNRGKSVLLAHIGEKPLTEGVQIAAAHIDSPRLDLKPNPLYEDGELAYFKTHYYGGIRKYQWVTIPLELHGVVALRDGASVQVNIGGGADDPRLVITDLLHTVLLTFRQGVELSAALSLTGREAAVTVVLSPLVYLLLRSVHNRILK